MRIRSFVVVLGILAGLGGCSHPSSDRTDGFASYVALGDSAVSGPMIDPPDKGAPPECFRSERNYPHLVAAELHSTLDDVSCGGATTDDVRFTFKNGRTQLDAVGPTAKLVTVGIGANDAGFAGAWFAACFLEGRSDAACENIVANYMPTYLVETRKRITGILDEVKHRAPQAKVLLVGYLRFAPSKGSCDELPISEANRAASVRLESDLAEMLRSAAKDASVEFVDPRASAKGHDICAGDQAWVNGLNSGDGSYLHPKAAGMKAVAAEVLRVLHDS